MIIRSPGEHIIYNILPILLICFAEKKKKNVFLAFL